MSNNLKSKPNNKQKTDDVIRLGVDVGGTNTDAVLICGHHVLASTKQTTTDNIYQGIENAVTDVLQQTDLSSEEIDFCMIGTTAFTNAFVQRRELNDVAIIRLGLPTAKALPPLTGWPQSMLDSFKQQVFMFSGGHHFNGAVNSDFSEASLDPVIDSILANSLTSVAISSVFSPINQEFELRAKQYLLTHCTDISVSMSHEIGRVGIIERENSTIMNASLAKLAERVVDAFESSLTKLNIKAPLYITQNDGTLMTADAVRQFPVMTFASGPTNSMRGAAFLSGQQEAIVADIGGTTTDIGMLQQGFPRESSMHVDIGGVRTNFRMPDIIAIGLGGGSICDPIKGTVGPQSVGYLLKEKAISFGGDVLTATDCTLKRDPTFIKEAKPELITLKAAQLDPINQAINQLISQGIDEIKTSRAKVPLILVGGGHILVHKIPAGISEIIRPQYAEVANAIGASIGMVSGDIDQIFDYDDLKRDESLELAKQMAIKATIVAGAIPDTVSILDIQEMPLSYIKGQATRIRIRATGQLFLTSQRAC
ncbi:hydantoinase/oxoprolinase family protein [Shewanella sp. D64]|uniref:hydantoinase/oxoprolinase family protein n=1 Tax=unclassified Shewanella TaxID=196818 RepID=UPI0022BA3A0B|nr:MULTISPECIES: hydantoinase/oxoprolinase family protein [unclassified Shewanella]MEC4728420.1 hydantoinase/oxoprolinase family protein [Shewanella sp. D64]MEC4740187.1 hydantoinase/oxoprolinase family protein [Shewanella sp. E94]WBJ96282.1 hydantoinase/oxoprolinase family protein [Shewanella sp. MTB7]